MCALAPEVTADQILRMFQRDAPGFFVGDLIIAAGLVAAAFPVIRRKYDPLLSYLAVFAVFYGVRMWMLTGLVQLTLQGSPLFHKLLSVYDYFILVPAFLFFRAAGFLHRGVTIMAYVLGTILGVLVVATLAFGGPRAIYYQISNVLVLAGLVGMVASSMRTDSTNPDFVVIRRGLLIFAAFAFWQNIQSVLQLGFRTVEPIGFMVLLGCLGYVAARQTLRRDRLLGEIQKELEVAKRIQLSILPAAFPNSASFRVAARYVPMTAVAGDFYDFIVADEQQAGLLIADVSGHGVPAALIASMVKLAATAQRANATDPSALLTGLNSALYGNTQNQFVTAAYVHLDSASKTLQYSAAGHPPMLLLRNGKVQEIAENGLMLAAFDFASYTTAVHALEAGDRLLLYTDGLTEAANTKGDFFGQEALSTLLQQTAQLAPPAASDKIISAIQQWSATQDDDLTVLICDYAQSG